VSLNDHVVSYRNPSKHLFITIYKNTFRIINIAAWNSLPNDVVSVDSTNIFKDHLDKFWYNQDLKFD